MQNFRPTSLLQADAAIKAELGVSQLGPILENKIIANDSIIMANVSSPSTQTAAICTPATALSQAKTNAASIIAQDIALKQRVTTARPEVNGVLGQPR